MSYLSSAIGAASVAVCITILASPSHAAPLSSYAPQGASIMDSTTQYSSDRRAERRYDDRRGRGDRYNGRGDDRNRYGGRHVRRAAAAQCRRAVNRDLRRYGPRGARIADIRDIDSWRNGFRVSGSIVAPRYQAHGYRGRDSGYGRGYGDRERAGYGRSAYQYGSFSCRYRDGRVARVNYRGIRGLR